MLIQPLSSHMPRCFVSLLMTYLKSVMVVRGTIGSICWSADITATILPTWFNWCSPGTLIVLFLGSFCLSYTPLLQAGSNFLLPMQLLSVYTVLSSILWPCSHLGWDSLNAGCCILSGCSAKIQKHMLSEFHIVIIGSNSISLPFSIATL